MRSGVVATTTSDRAATATTTSTSDRARRPTTVATVPVLPDDPADPPSWFTCAFPENFQDVDFIYGGWDRDALQADQAANGPDPGDRLADWAGGFNVFYVCPAGYGDYTITRQWVHLRSGRSCRT